MHYFEDFKGFARAQLDLQRPLTVLVGPNGSGKSNIIEGVELLSFIAQGGPLHEIADAGRGTPTGLEIRGGLASCPSYEKDSFRLGSSGRIKFENRVKRFTHRVTVSASPHPRIVDESLIFDDGTLVFETLGPSKGRASGDILVRYNNFARGGKKPQVPVSAGRSVLAQYPEFARRHSKYVACAVLAAVISYELESSFVLDPVPKLMRGYERMGRAKLARNGSNLSAVLHYLSFPEGRQSPAIRRLLNWIRQLPEEPYSELDFVTTDLMDVIFGLRETTSGQLVDARQVSDGTLRALAVLTALETAREGSRVIIEEFDNGLHPSRVQVLTDALKSCCERRKLNVLVTTHNPATLNALHPEQLDGVVLCVWDKRLGAFNLVRLSELPRHGELLERGRLGDLVTRRVIDEYLAPDFEEKRKTRALKWLESLP